MLKNHFKIALRTLLKHKGYALINVLGLAVGMACCLLILLFVRHERSYDRFHEQADRIHRIVSTWGDFSLPATNWPFVERLRTDFPELEIAHLLRTGGRVRHEDRVFREDALFFAPPSFFDVFSFRLLRGDPERALANPYQVVLTEPMARKYFGSEDPVGKTLTVFTDTELEVVGLIEEAPENAHFHHGLIASWSTLDAAFGYEANQGWGNNSVYTYLLFPEGYAPEDLEAQLPAFIERHAGEDWNGAALSLQRLTDIHLHSHHNMELEPNGRAAYVYLFSAIALFILLLACINFTNLSTARASERAKEVGVRKVVGARRGQLAGQFLAESVLLALLASGVALLLVEAALPALRTLSGRDLSVGSSGQLLVVLALLALGAVTGLLAGSYPALALSSFRPASVLKGPFRSSARGARLRQGLVVFQFTVSVVLIVGTLVVRQQLSFLRNTGLGFDQEQVVALPVQSGAVLEQSGAFREALLQNPAVEAVAVASERLPSELLNGHGVRLAGAPVEDEADAVSVRVVSVGHGFFEALGVDMTAGHPFRRDAPSDSAGFVLNERAAALLQGRFAGRLAAPEALVGEQIQVGEDREGPVLGIVEDFNLSTLHEPIEPVLFYMRPAWYNTFLVRVAPGDMAETVASLRETWEQFFPAWPFEFSFADQAFDAQYRAEERLAQVFGLFAALAIFIACLGLFGLAAFATEQRTKEIGVRKVLGASVTSIVALLSKDFLKLVLAALAAAVPIAFVAMTLWLEDFAYHIELGPGVFVVTGGVALAIALFTVSYQALKAALADPVRSLRYE